VRLMDPFTVAAVTTLFVVVSTVAIILPAWRSARLDPVAALKQD